MGLLATVKGVMLASTQSADRGDVTGERSEGAYWCDDCSERIRDVDVEGEAPPSCPTCDEEMRFERAQGSTGCAC